MSTWIALFILIFGWDIFWGFLGVRPLFPWQLKSHLKKFQETSELLDVRTKGEYQLFHIQGVRNAPDIAENPQKYLPENLEKPVVLICMSGHRSPMAAWQLKKAGASKVYNLTWGMLGWKLFFGKTESGQ